ncbi:hypothetical protein ACJJTC_011506 [Scirpophaga incertulas]
MATVRTPAKKQIMDNSPEPSTSQSMKGQSTKTMPPNTNVRKSIGEWEAGLTVETCDSDRHSHSPSKAIQDKAPVATQKTKQRTATPPVQKETLQRRPSAETAPDTQIPVPKKKGSANRVAEAKEWLEYGKQNINASRNMKADLRKGAILAVNNLHRMIGELMEELRRKTALPEPSAPTAPPVPETGTVGAEGREEEIKKVREIQERIEGLIKTQTETINKTQQETEKIRQYLENESHCGGPHLRRECEDWMAGMAPRCCNCASAKKTQAGEGEHNAFSSDCPIRRRWEMAARAKIAYC